MPERVYFRIKRGKDLKCRGYFAAKAYRYIQSPITCQSTDLYIKAQPVTSSAPQFRIKRKLNSADKG